MRGRFFHPSAWNRNSRKFISKILHSLTLVPRKHPSPGTLHSSGPTPLVTPMDRYARSWMFFLQTLVCTSQRTSYAPSRMLQVAGRGYAELLRNPISGSSATEDPTPPRPLYALLSLSRSGPAVRCACSPCRARWPAQAGPREEAHPPAQLL